MVSSKAATVKEYLDELPVARVPVETFLERYQQVKPAGKTPPKKGRSASRGRVASR